MTTLNNKNAAIKSSVNLRGHFAASNGLEASDGNTVIDMRIDDIKIGYTQNNREFFSAMHAGVRKDANGGLEDDHNSDNAKKKRAERDREQQENMLDEMMTRIESDIQDMQISLREIDEQIEENRIALLRNERYLAQLIEEESESAQDIQRLEEKREKQEQERRDAERDEREKEREARDAEQKVSDAGGNASDSDKEDARKKEEARRDAAEKREQKEREIAETERRIAQEQEKQRQRAEETERVKREQENLKREGEDLDERRRKMQEKLQEKLREREALLQQNRGDPAASAAAPTAPAAEQSPLQSQFKAAHDATKAETTPAPDAENQQNYVSKQILNQQAH